MPEVFSVGEPVRGEGEFFAGDRVAETYAEGVEAETVLLWNGVIVLTESDVFVEH